MKTKSDDGVHMSTKSMNAILVDKLKYEITSHRKCANLANIDHVINYFINDLNYAWNEYKQSWRIHHVEGELMVPRDMSVHDMIDRLLSDPSTACLLATRTEVERYERPRHNPWIRGQWFNLGLQGKVFTHERDLAQKWKKEAQRVNDNLAN